MNSKSTINTKWLMAGIVTLLTGCQPDLNSASQGLANTKDGMTNSYRACAEITKASDDADEVLRLKSSEDHTMFYVDGTPVTKYPVKQLKVCINSKSNHTIVAEPDGCAPKTERLEPPYNAPIYEFQFMLGDCKIAQPPENKTPEHRPPKSNRSSL